MRERRPGGAGGEGGVELAGTSGKAWIAFEKRKVGGVYHGIEKSLKVLSAALRSIWDEKRASLVQIRVISSTVVGS